MIKGDTRSLDSSSCSSLLGFVVFVRNFMVDDLDGTAYEAYRLTPLTSPKHAIPAIRARPKSTSRSSTSRLERERRAQRRPSII